MPWNEHIPAVHVPIVGSDPHGSWIRRAFPPPGNPLIRPAPPFVPAFDPNKTGTRRHTYHADVNRSWRRYGDDHSLGVSEPRGEQESKQQKMKSLCHK
jgi:hypothetical protein